MRELADGVTVAGSITALAHAVPLGFEHEPDTVLTLLNYFISLQRLQAYYPIIFLDGDPAIARFGAF